TTVNSLNNEPGISCNPVIGILSRLQEKLFDQQGGKYDCRNQNSDIEDSDGHWMNNMLLFGISTVSLRVLHHALTVFIDLEIKGEFSANTYGSAILFFAGHKFPLLNSFDYCIANAFGRRF